MTNYNNREDELFNDIEEASPLRSSSINEVISRKQGFLTQWASLLFLIILIIIFIAINFIHYPDIIKVRAKLIGFNAPKEIMARQDGKIVKLFFKNNDFVSEGNMLFWIESTADHKNVIDLDILLDSSIYYLSNNEEKKINYFTENKFTNLGEIQTSYHQFILAYQLFKNSFINGFVQNKFEILNNDINGINISNSKLRKQKDLTEEDIKLLKEDYSAFESLFTDKIISIQELRVEKSKVLNRQLGIPQIETIILSNEALLRQKKKEIYELQHSNLEQKEAFVQAIKTLKSRIDDWKKKFIVYAPVSGKVIFTISIQESKFLTNTNNIGYINPLSSKYYAEVILPQSNFGKIFLGQNVQLRFDAYQYNEFGIVNGKMDYISNVASDTGFIAQISLPKGLLTTQNKLLQYNSGLMADALIVTNDITIYKRMVYSLLKETNR